MEKRQLILYVTAKQENRREKRRQLGKRINKLDDDIINKRQLKKDIKIRNDNEQKTTSSIENVKLQGQLQDAP